MIIDDEEFLGNTDVRPPTQKEIYEAGDMFTLTPMQRIAGKRRSKQLVAFFDAGSNIHLVRRKYADKAGWKGKPIQQLITTAGGVTREWDTMQYSIPLVKSDGTEVRLLATALEQITEELVEVKVDYAAQMFGCAAQDIDRPAGHVDLLIRDPSRGNFPHIRAIRGDLRLLDSDFGSGLLLEGAHPKVKPDGGELTMQAFSMSRATVRYNSHLHMSRGKVRQRAQANFVCAATYNFFEAEELGIGQPRRCGMCQNCARCSVHAREMTAQEQGELALIESNIKFDKEARCVTFQYPHIKDVSKLENNRGQATAIASKVEKRLEKVVGTASMMTRCMGTVHAAHLWSWRRTR